MGLDGLGADGLGRSSLLPSPPPSPNNEKVARGLAVFSDSTAAAASRAFLSLVRLIVAPGFAPFISLIAAAILAFLVAGWSLKKYRLPDAVCTTDPFSIIPLAMGEVSTDSPC